MNEKNNLLFVLCDCKSEVLVIEYDKEYELADLAIYENIVSYTYKMSFWQKVRYIWRILFHSRPYADQIVLTKDQLIDLSNFIGSLNLK